MSDTTYMKQGDAYAWLKDNGYDLARSTFNNHWNGVTKLKTPLRVDYAKKSIHIDSLKVYAAGLSKQEISREVDEAERATLDLRKLRAEVSAAENKADRERISNKKDDERWMEVVDHDRQLAAFAGQIEESLKQITTIKLSELIFIVGGELGRASEFAHALDRLYAAALTDAVREQTKTITFAEEEHDDTGE